MIKESELLDAIAECQGERNPDAKTCIKLAAFYTILNQMYPQSPELTGYSRQEPPEQVRYDSGSEFSRVIQDVSIDVLIGIIDELMDALMVLSPRLYRATLDKLSDK